MMHRRAAMFLLTAGAALAELRAGRSQLKLAGEELMLKAVVLDDGETRAAMVTADLASLDASAVNSARKIISSAGAFAIPEFNIMIAVTGARAARLSDPAARNGQLAARIAEVVRLAAASIQPVSVSAGLGREEAIAFFDRFLMKDGSVRANPGKMNPDIVQPAGEADPELVIARIESISGGQALAVFASFSLRASVIDPAHQSADYPGVITRTLAKLHGAEFVTLWSTGAGANVTHLDVRSARPQQGLAEAWRVGTVLAGEAIKAGARAEKIGGKLGVAREVIKLAAAKTGLPGIEAEVQAIALGGSLAWVALPGELWSELGTAIRKASPFPHTLLVGSANGAAAGLLPTRKGYAPAGPALSPGVIAASGSGETVADAAARLLSAARRQAAGQ